MKKIIIQRDYNILDNFKYDIQTEDRLFNAQVEYFSDIVAAIRTKEIYYSKIPVFDAKETKIEVFKHYPNPILEYLFTIKINDKLFRVREGKNLVIPDLYIRTNYGRLNVWGKVNAQEFEIHYKDKIYSKICGDIVKDKKVYTIEYDDTLENIEEFSIGVALILDNLYNDH